MLFDIEKVETNTKYFQNHKNEETVKRILEHQTKHRVFQKKIIHQKSS